MKHSFIKCLMVSPVLGLVAPSCWFLAQAVFGGDLSTHWQILYSLERLIRVIWPSFIWLMATDGIEGTPTAYFFIFISVAANVILYAVVGSVLWRLKGLLLPTKR